MVAVPWTPGREALARLSGGIPDKAALYNHWKHNHGLTIPHVAVCPGHQAPLDFAVESYLNPHNSVTLANRGGGKTQILGLLEGTEAECKRAELGHVAATLGQGDKLRGYLRDYFQNREKELLKVDAARNLELYSGGKLDVLTATLKGVNAPHPRYVSIDEFDEIDLVVWLQAISMAMATGDDPHTATRVLSTWKFPVGLMTDLLDHHEERGFRIWRWCVFETLQRCDKPDCADCHDAKCYDRLGKAHTWADVCDGRARRSSGYMLLDDVIRKFRAMSGHFETFESEHLCLRPEMLGQYYAHYRSEIHEIAPGNAAGWKPDPEYGHYVWVDPGVNSPNAIAIAQPVPDGSGGFDLVIVDGMKDGDGDTLLQTWPLVEKLRAPYGKLKRAHGDCYGYNRQNARLATPVFSLLEQAHGVSIVPCPKKLMGYETRSGAMSERFAIKADGHPRMRVWTGTPGGREIARAFSAVRKKEIGGIPMSDEPDLTKQDSKMAFNFTSACEYGVVLIDICGQG